MTSKTVHLGKFFGVDNVADPERLKPGWLRVADNVDITPQGAITRRPGYELVMTGAFTGAYATIEQDADHLYVVDAGELKQIHEDMTSTVLRTGLTSAPLYWAEINNQTFFSNGPDKGIIKQDGTVLDWGWPVPSAPEVTVGSGGLPAGQYSVACTFTLPDGRETGASEATYAGVGNSGGCLTITSIPQVAGCLTNIYVGVADSTVLQYALTTTGTSVTWNDTPDSLGEELMTYGLDPVPLGATVIALWQGRAWAAEYSAADDVSIVWASEPLGFHLFNLQSAFLQVPGKVLLLLPHAQGIIIGTHYALYVWDGEKLTSLASYGVPAGRAGTVDVETGVCWFWTNRGLCRGLPFENLTSGRLHTDPGTHASTTIVQMGGLKKLITTTRPSGAVFNPRTQQ